MSERKKDSYTFYLNEDSIRTIDEKLDMSRSEVARSAIGQWLDENVDSA